MKRQIRRNVFETNSSSTHSISISKKPVTIDTAKVIGFEIGEYGWENDCVSAKNYLYTAIMSFNDSEELLKKMTDILDKNNVKYYLGEVIKQKAIYDDEVYTYLDNGYIDHHNETREFVETVLDNEDMFMRLIFGDSCVYTGNDNQYDIPDGCDIAKSNYYDYGSDKYVSNPYHDAENYDYFYKGN